MADGDRPVVESSVSGKQAAPFRATDFPTGMPALSAQVSEAPQHPILTHLPPEPNDSAGIMDRAVPWMLSLLVHQVILIVLALCVVSGIAGGGGDAASLFASFAADEDLIEDSILATETLETPDASNTPEFDVAEFSEPSAAGGTEVVVEQDELLSEVQLAGLTFEPADLMSELPGRITRSEIDTGGLREATSVEGATGGVVGDILGELAQGNLLVVWLFDQSISLVDDRQRVAVKLAELFEVAQARASESGHILKNAAVAFGAQVRQMVPPTESTQRIVKAVGQVPIDESGIERPFGAVAWAAEKYAKRSDERIVIVVWTDESGDDTDRLEKTIAVCRERNVSVSVVGPSAILGRREGTHSWVHQPTGRVFQLGVVRGPDSAVPERIALPYWWPTRGPQENGLSAGWRRGRGGNLPPWYGGEQLEGMGSGVGPYALTRLALETGGTYTIFDRPLDRGPFRLESMRPYAPDYRAEPIVLRELQYRPLPRAVLQAVDLLSRQSPAMQPSNDYFGRRYRSPVDFRGQLKNALKIEATRASQHLKAVDTALSAFGADGMEKEYDEESSPRFRAWYDVTRGRLLAVSVRYLEFIQACELTLRSLNGATNRVVFVPSTELRCGSTARYRAEDAERLLQRCVEDHAETPWAYLAQRELDYPLGVDLQQSMIPKPPPRPPAPARPGGHRGGGGGGGAITLPKL